jgi:hypothetical protein
LFNVGVDLEFVRDFVLLADVVVVADNLSAWRMEGSPIGILREGKRIERSRNVAI